MATTLDIFSELLASIAHIQTLVAKNSVFQALQEINDTLYNVQRMEVVPGDIRDQVQLHLTDARVLARCLPSSRLSRKILGTRFEYPARSLWPRAFARLRRILLPAENYTMKIWHDFWDSIFLARSI